jgi:hypothetical protein
VLAIADVIYRGHVLQLRAVVTPSLVVFEQKQNKVGVDSCTIDMLAEIPQRQLSD